MRARSLIQPISDMQTPAHCVGISHSTHNKIKCLTTHCTQENSMAGIGVWHQRGHTNQEQLRACTCIGALSRITKSPSDFVSYFSSEFRSSNFMRPLHRSWSSFHSGLWSRELEYSNIRNEITWPSNTRACGSWRRETQAKTVNTVWVNRRSSWKCSRAEHQLLRSGRQRNSAWWMWSSQRSSWQLQNVSLFSVGKLDSLEREYSRVKPGVVGAEICSTSDVVTKFLLSEVVDFGNFIWTDNSGLFKILLLFRLLYLWSVSGLYLTLIISGVWPQWIQICEWSQFCIALPQPCSKWCACDRARYSGPTPLIG